MAVRAPGKGRGVAEESVPGTRGLPAGALQQHFLWVGRARSGFAAPDVKLGSREEAARGLRLRSAAGAGRALLPGRCCSRTFLPGKWGNGDCAGRGVSGCGPRRRAEQILLLTFPCPISQTKR